MRGRGFQTVAALGLTIAMSGCGDGSLNPLLPVSPSSPSPLPAPPPAPIGSGVLSGVVVETTSTGRTPVEGATIYIMTCGISNCPDVKGYSVTTDAEGSYRIAGVYNGDLNYVWISKEGYQLINPMAPGTCPDNCDRTLTVNGETRLDVELARR